MQPQRPIRPETPHNMWARPVSDQPWPGPVRAVATQPVPESGQHNGYVVPRSPGMGGVVDGRPSRSRRGSFARTLGWVVLAIVFSLSGLLTLAAITANTGPIGVLLGTGLALLPLLIVVLSLLWLDRYENEPAGMLALAFVWGASVAALISLILNTTAAILLEQTAPDAGAVVVAPLVEEVAKGAGILFVLLLRRGRFDGMVDGIVYAGFTAAGFAFTENILYFGRAYSEYAAEGLIQTFIARGLASPFAHPMFTAMTGIGIGIAVTARHTVVRILAPLTGLMCAIILHSLWNFFAISVADAGLEVLLLPLALFAVFVGFIVFVRRREGALIARHLQTYARFGWLTAQDVNMLSSLRNRRLALQWAGRMQGPDGKRAMRRYQDVAVELAFLRERIESGTSRPSAQRDEYALLGTLWQLRGRFVR